MWSALLPSSDDAPLAFPDLKTWEVFGYEFGHTPCPLSEYLSIRKRRGVPVDWLELSCCTGLDDDSALELAQYVGHVERDDAYQYINSEREEYLDSEEEEPHSAYSSSESDCSAFSLLTDDLDLFG
jgi:hypothetical protein